MDVSGRKLRFSPSQSTTRFSVHSARGKQVLGDQNFEHRSSRRMSISGKFLPPRLSIADNPTTNRKKVLTFEVKEDKERRPTQADISRAISQLSYQSIKKRSKHKLGQISSLSELIGYQYSEADLRRITKNKAQFSGDLIIEDPSSYTDKIIEKLPSECPSGFYSKLANSGSLEDDIEDTWPWPWLPPTSDSSIYLHKFKSAVTFSKQNTLPAIPLETLGYTLVRFLNHVRLFLSYAELERVHGLLAQFVHNGGVKLDSRLSEESNITRYDGEHGADENNVIKMLEEGKQEKSSRGISWREPYVVNDSSSSAVSKSNSAAKSVSKENESLKETENDNKDEAIKTEKGGGEAKSEDSKNLECTRSRGSQQWVDLLVPSFNMYLTRLEAPLANTAILPPFIWDLWPPRENSQMSRAVTIIQLVAEFYRLIHSERLNIFYDSNGHPQCNEQFRKLFSSTKIPGIPSDAIHCFFKTITEPKRKQTPSNLVVICHGLMFSLEFLQDDMATMPEDELRESLEKIITMAEDKVSCSFKGLNVLTSMDRDEWSESRVAIMELSENNRRCLQKVEEAVFVLSLDHVNARSPEHLPTEARFADGCNRFYDKGLNFYLYKNGLVTVNACSSIVDPDIVSSLLHFMHLRILENTEKWDDEVRKISTAVSRIVSSEHVNREHEMRSISNLNIAHKTESEASGDGKLVDEGDYIMPLQFDTNKQIEQTIQDAKLTFNRIENCFSSATCHFWGFEWNLFHIRKIDVDAFAHLAIQLNYYRMYFRPAAVGSKVSIKRFYNGRRDTMMTTTAESIAWCRAMLNPDVTGKERVFLFSAAIAAHGEHLEKVRSGKGCYHHVSALRQMAGTEDEYSGKILDELFDLRAGSDETMDIMCEGTHPRTGLCVTVPRPPSHSSYGIGYAIANTKALFVVTSWKSNPGTCAENFAAMMHYTLNELRTFLLKP